MNVPETTLTPAIDPDAIRKLFDITGQRAFIPGGYGAIGEALAFAMAAHGAIVTIAGPRIEKARDLAVRIGGTGGQAHGLMLDAASVDSIRKATSEAVEVMGGIDTLVNCVGIQREQSILDVTPETFDMMLDTNLRSAMLLGQAVARDQIAGGQGGRQIHLLSVRAQLALRGRGYSAYCATKGGLAMLVKQHAMELAPTTSR